MTDPIIQAIGLTKSYGEVLAADNVSFEVMPGEIVGFLGPNGAGKTTTIKMITGLLSPTSGQAIVGGHNIQTDAIAAKAMIGYVPDTPNLYDKLSAEEYLRFVGQLYRVPSDMVEKRMREMLGLFELSEVAGNYLDTYSHGMQQKVAMTGAFIHDPAIVFMDEPTVGLDPRSARLIKDLMIAKRNVGHSILFSTHILEIAQNMCDRVIIINKGKVVADARVDELRKLSGDQSLEDIFLELTGSKEVDELVSELAND